MADILQCPNCKTENPIGSKVCKNCQTPLAPANKITGGFIKPGQTPTKKHTADLEPILPQWLRDARNAARGSDSPNSMELPQPQEEKDKPSAPPPAEDLLSGLQSSQTADEEEEEYIPDWLVNLTGKSPTTPHEASSEPITNRRVEMGNTADFPHIKEEPTEEPETPSWLAGLQSPATEPEKDELTEWFRSASEAEQPHHTVEPKIENPVSTPQPDESPDWLRQMAMDAEQTEDAQTGISQAESEFPADAPDWLRNLGSAIEVTPSSGLNPFNLTEPAPAESEALASSTETPEWLKNESQKQDTTPKWLQDEGASSEAGTPAWLANETPVQRPPEPDSQPLSDDIFTELPGWLKAAAPESSIFNQPAKEPEASPEPQQDSQDWLKAFQLTPEATQEPENIPAFSTDFHSDENVNSLFTEMPDWLSNAMEPGSGISPSTSPAEDALAPSDLPSWVQAMRPVDTSKVVEEKPNPTPNKDLPLESRGALAGLHGVLPAMPGFTPTSKPKSYSIKLNASKEQMAHAEILEQVLAAETSPDSIETLSTYKASRALRWFVAFIVFVFVAIPVFLRTQIFSAPVGVPNETRDAISVVQAIPESSALLVAFDYEPSRAGELEASAAPVFDQLLLLKHPRLTFISTNEIGSSLAERFISGPLAGHNYQSGATYLNLGYLSGGQLGIRAFAQNPANVAPVDINSQSAWTSAPLQGVTALNQFAAVILITDNADSARAWIEQTEITRKDTPILVISSAQSTPMIQPYYASGQVDGILSGLYGGAIFEQYNAGRPGTARMYWDAYSIGMFIAVLLVLFGGLWNLALGLRDRQPAGKRKN